ncbi:MAG: nucleotidyl transferase AbiEii/AbiGii toxin family protein [Deltaproteobacteria bacterium]|nr:nucleotidyl transferase AbiEii/AbiGii toxin family protein [Deltaproteobacteria bacterium]MDQ3295765.1 nucleotidyl transferase AbiEii/AbiGii toxin family protein [Myxococcota bacterium]
MTFVPRLDILPPAQRAVWPELADVPRTFVLYGGTGLALRLGHRASIDFDFFASAPLEHEVLERLALVRDGITVQHGPSERTVLVERAGATVKLSFFGALPFGRVAEPTATVDGVLRVASLLDLGGTKIKALLQRVEAKDYRDIAALLANGVALTEILGAGQALFGTGFNPLIAQKALCYFKGGDLESLDALTRDLLATHAAQDLDIALLPLAAARVD